MFIAVLLLEFAGKRPYKHSAVFDMESFFWTFLYVLFHQKRSTLNDSDAALFKKLHPSDVSSYDSDSDSKIALFVKLSTSIDEGSVLSPLQSLIIDMADLACSLYRQGLRNARDVYNVEIYSEGVEVKAIEDYIRIFESMRSTLDQT